MQHQNVQGPQFRKGGRKTDMARDAQSGGLGRFQNGEQKKVAGKTEKPIVLIAQKTGDAWKLHKGRQVYLVKGGDRTTELVVKPGTCKLMTIADFNVQAFRDAGKFQPPAVVAEPEQPHQGKHGGKRHRKLH